jgi:hypothetical protein
MMTRHVSPTQGVPEPVELQRNAISTRMKSIRRGFAAGLIRRAGMTKGLMESCRFDPAIDALPDADWRDFANWLHAPYMSASE